MHHNLLLVQPDFLRYSKQDVSPQHTGKSTAECCVSLGYRLEEREILIEKEHKNNDQRPREKNKTKQIYERRLSELMFCLQK